MASIEERGRVKPADFTAELRTMDTGALAAQQCVQQGAIHAVAWLLRNGCNPETAANMLASLRVNMELTRAEGIRRGAGNLFPEDQTGFS